MESPFYLPNEQYKRNIDILNSYIKDCAKLLSISENIDIKEAEKFVIDTLKNNEKYKLKDRCLHHTVKDKNGDKLVGQSGLLQYLKDIVDQNDIIAPTLTRYVNSKIKKSLLSTWTKDKIEVRDVIKAKMYEAMALGDKVMTAIHQNGQNNAKIKNNALSGAQTSPFTILYNSSAHNSMTTTCRLTAGYGNVNNEKLLGGNRHYYDPHVVINNFISIGNNIDTEVFKNVIERFNLHIPTTDEIMDLIVYSSHFYWSDSDMLYEIRKIVEKSSDIDKVAFAYVGDLYHLAKFNDTLVRDMINRLSTKIETGTLENYKEIIPTIDSDIMLSAWIMFEDQVKGLKFGKASDEIMQLVTLTAMNINSVFIEHFDLFRAILTTINVPAALSKLPSMVRRQVITSDTDSTIFTVSNWVKWFNHGTIEFNQKNKAIAEIMCLITRQNITHLLALMSKNINVAPDMLKTIQMKNEFNFIVYGNANVKKHYFSKIIIQEGLILKEPKLEIKGVQLINSNTPKIINDYIINLVKDILYTIENNKQIDIRKILLEMSELEKSIIKNINTGNVDYYRTIKIKSASSYALSEEQSPYSKHLFWNHVFGPAFGVVGEPPYSVYKIPTTLYNQATIDEWVAVCKDKALASRLNSYLESMEKKNYPTLFIPTLLYTGKPLPLDIASLVDKRRVIADVCGSLYIILETLGIYIKGNKGGAGINSIKSLVSDYL